MGCQRDIAQKVLDQKADYVLALKGNQGSLREDVDLSATEQKAKAFTNTRISQDTTIDADHGRIETRTTTVIHDVQWLQQRHNWPGLKAVVVVEGRREISGKIEQETRYYTTSLGAWRIFSGRLYAAAGRSKTACIGSWTWSFVWRHKETEPYRAIRHMGWQYRESILHVMRDQGGPEQFFAFLQKEVWDTHDRFRSEVTAPAKSAS